MGDGCVIRRGMEELTDVGMVARQELGWYKAHDKAWGLPRVSPVESG